MESNNAGLLLVRTIRTTLELTEVRIILRTGQPGYAPEINVIRDFDINDYKTKNELTHDKLLTAITSSLRSYQQIRTINLNRIGLEKIVRSGADLLEAQSMEVFADGVLTQIASLLGLREEGILAAQSPDNDDLQTVYIFGAAGHYTPFINKRLDELDDSVIRERLTGCLARRQHIRTEHDSAYYFGNQDHGAAVYIESGVELESPYPELLEVFLNSVTAGYENVALFEKLRRTAYIDPLTQLANRNEFIRLLEVNSCQCDDGCTALLVDIDHFSDINHALGQDMGDQLLRAVASRLRTRFSELADIARVDADVFALIGSQEGLSPERLHEALKEPFALDDTDIQVNVSLGLCAFTGEVMRGSTILNRAFMALSMAKQSSYRSVAYFTPEMKSLTRNRLEKIRELREAFENDRLTLYYQPQISLLTQQVIGAEALLRWPLDNGEFVPPGEFIPLAEQSGLIVKIGIWVIDRACAQLAPWQANGYEHQTLSVNVSMLQFRSPDFVNQIRATVDRYDFRRDTLILEITESVIMDEPTLVLASLHLISKLGLRISLDDFGMGFSSLNYLRQMPLDELKVDKSFINDMENESGLAVIESIIQLSHRLGLSSVAEGVENEAQLNTVKAMGCKHVQGFYYSPALALPEFQQFMDTFVSSD